MGKKSRAQILKDKKERVAYVVRLVKNKIHDNYSLRERLSKESWYNEVHHDTITSYIKEAKRIVKSSVSTDFILNSSFVFDELKQMYENTITSNDNFMRLKVLQEMAKVQGLHDSDLRKEILYRENLLEAKTKSEKLQKEKDDKLKIEVEKIESKEKMTIEEIRNKRIERNERNERRII